MNNIFHNVINRYRAASHGWENKLIVNRSKTALVASLITNNNTSIKSFSSFQHLD